MPSRKLFALMLVAWLATAVTVYAQATDTAAPTEGEELTSAAPATPASPAEESAEKSEEAAPSGDEEQVPPQDRQPGGFFNNYLLFIMLGVLVLLIFWSSRSRKKQEAKRQAMLASLKKGDKVTSIGGIVGTIIEVRDDELVVKVDETNNVRMRFARWAIRGTGEQAKTESPEDKK